VTDIPASYLGCPNSLFLLKKVIEEEEKRIHVRDNLFLCFKNILKFV
jgi:hypothetical protein